MVLTSSGEVLTNNHVINGATTIKVVVRNTGRDYTADVVGYDRSADVAVLQLMRASNLKTVSAASASKLTAGDVVTAVGNAAGAGSLRSVTGRITGIGKTITASDDQGGSEQLTGLIEMNAAVEPGDSGGPLLNSSGQVIGMDTAASVDGYGFQATAASDAYAIPISTALTVARQIEAGKATTALHVGPTAFLGVEVESVDAAPDGYRSGMYDSSAPPGALYAGVVLGGPADSAGLGAGDVIHAIDGHAVASPGAVTAIVLTKQPGEKLSVRYTDQYGGSHTTTARLGNGPPQ